MAALSHPINSAVHQLVAASKAVVGSFWHPLHAHPVREHDHGWGWNCDICRQHFGGGGASKRWRCVSGCDFDFCDACMAKSPAMTAAVASPEIQYEMAVVETGPANETLEVPWSDVRLAPEPAAVTVVESSQPDLPVMVKLVRDFIFA